MKRLLLISLVLFLACEDKQEKDCADVEGGTAQIDSCGLCTGGTTGLLPNYLKDCTGECGGNNICGCTDSNALNYDSTATFNDNNCNYDTTPPTVSISSPASGQTVIDIVTIIVATQDNEGISKVEFFIDDSLHFTDTESPYQYDWNTTVYDDGSYTIFVRSYDTSGNTTDSDLTTLTVDNPPNIIYSTIEEGNDVLTNAGLIIQFSEAMDLNIFEADTIITSVDILDENGVELNFSLSNIKIQNSNYIKLNNEPQTFYYDPSTFTCAFIQTTSGNNTEGTGEGFIIQEGDNEFKIGDEYLLNFTNNDVGGNGGNTGYNIEYIRTWPNPYYFFHQEESYGEHYLTFTHLPEHTGCIITIYTHLGEEIRIIEHNGNQYHSWDLKNEDGEDIVSGIYRYEVVYESISFTNGVMVIER